MIITMHEPKFHTKCELTQYLQMNPDSTGFADIFRIGSPSDGYNKD